MLLTVVTIFVLFSANDVTVASIRFELNIRIYRPTVQTTRRNVFVGFTNDPSTMNDYQKRIFIDVCDSRFPQSRIHSIYFTVLVFYVLQPTGQPNQKLSTTDQCYIELLVPYTGQFLVNISASLNGEVIASGSKPYEIRNIWYVALGDSFASGQGSPDQQASSLNHYQASWISRDCARSSRSFSFKTYKQLLTALPDQGVLFTYLACSGAGLLNGVLQDQPTSNHLTIPSQLEVLKKMVQKPSLIPDVLTITIGANDLGISDIVHQTSPRVRDELVVRIQSSLSILSVNFDHLAEWFADNIGMNPENVFVLDYYDVLKNERGFVDGSCGEMWSTNHFNWVQKHVTIPLNKMISQKCHMHNWTYVPVYELFQQNGICSRRRLILNRQESIYLQGNPFGWLHPLERGHQKVAEQLWSYMRNSLELKDQRNNYIF